MRGERIGVPGKHGAVHEMFSNFNKPLGRAELTFRCTKGRAAVRMHTCCVFGL